MGAGEPFALVLASGGWYVVAEEDIGRRERMWCVEGGWETPVAWRFRCDVSGQFCLPAFEVYDDSYRPLGNAAAQIIQKFEPGDRGAFIGLVYFGCSDQLYRWYVENMKPPGGGPKNTIHHLCRDDCSKCKATPKGSYVIHCRRWSPAPKEAANACLNESGYCGLAGASSILRRKVKKRMSLLKEDCPCLQEGCLESCSRQSCNSLGCYVGIWGACESREGSWPREQWMLLPSGRKRRVG